MEIFLWGVVIVGYLVAITCVYKVYVFAFSLFNEVPFVASDTSIIRESLKYLDLKSTDNFIDIGSGDGKVVFLAHKLYPNLKSYTGIDFSTPLILQSNLKRKLMFLNNVKFHKKDALMYNYSQYNKVFLYMTTDMTSRIMNVIKDQLPEKSIVVSAVFGMGEFEKENEVTVHKVKLNKKEVTITIWKK